MHHKLNHIKISKNFYLDEFECPCCNSVKLHPQLLFLLQRLRDLWQKPIIITSGYRCPKHNKEVGGIKTSKHLQGKAVDIVALKYEQKTIINLANKLNLKAIPYTSRNFIHLQLK